MSIYRKVLFVFKGYREFLMNGYEKASKLFTEGALDVDCSNKSYMITGANSGIGKATAFEICKRGGTVHMVCRNAKAAEEAKQEIIELTGNDKIKVHIVDLSDSEEVLQFCENFIKSCSSLDALINNAGCLLHSRVMTKQNNDTMFAVMTLSSHILSTKLFPILEKSEKCRIILVSSGGMFNQKLDIDDVQCLKMEPYEGAMVYSQSKRQQVIMAEQYAKMYPNIHFSSMHPGWVETPAFKTSLPDFYAKVKDKVRSPKEGADTVVWLAISDEALKNPSGHFYQDRQPVSTHLPLAWTTSSDDDKIKLINILDKIVSSIEANKKTTLESIVSL